MEIRDITERAFETLTLLRAMEEFVKDGMFSDVNSALLNFEESLTDEDHIEYVEDLYMLIKAGYLLSDAKEEDIEKDILPTVDGFSKKGTDVLDEYVREVEAAIAAEAEAAKAAEAEAVKAAEAAEKKGEAAEKPEETGNKKKVSLPGYVTEETIRILLEKGIPLFAALAKGIAGAIGIWCN